MKRFLYLYLIIMVLFFSCVSDSSIREQSKEEETMKDQELKPEDDPNVEKYCALTFDDGPEITQTTRVLDKLEAYGVVASFFVVGQRINESTRAVLERAVAMGCEIHNHSWAYASLDKMTAEEVKKSVDDTTKAIEEYAGVSPAFFRPPNLAKSKTMYDAIDLPFAEGILGMDWAGCNTSAEDRANNILRAMKDGVIILLHDVQPEPHPTPEALDILIPELKKKGYKFVTLTKLFEIKGVTPDPEDSKAWKYVQ